MGVVNALPQGMMFAGYTNTLGASIFLCFRYDVVYIGHVSCRQQFLILPVLHIAPCQVRHLDQARFVHIHHLSFRQTVIGPENVRFCHRLLHNDLGYRIIKRKYMT
jgi:hypothetical protein